MLPPKYRLIIYTIFFAAIVNTSKTEDIQNDPSFVDLCPPAGNVGDRFKINALGTKLPRLGGCATKKLSNQIDFWIGKLKFGDAHCPPIGSNIKHYGIKHYIFDCKNAWYAKPEHGDVNRFVYATLQERTPHKLGRNVFKCSMYEQNKGYTMRLAIAENNNCTGLRERLTQAPNQNPIQNAEWMDGFMFLDISPHIERSPEETAKRNESINNRFKNERGMLMDFVNRLDSHASAKENSSIMNRDVPNYRHASNIQDDITDETDNQRVVPTITRHIGNVRKRRSTLRSSGEENRSLPFTWLQDVIDDFIVFGGKNEEEKKDQSNTHSISNVGKDKIPIETTTLSNQQQAWHNLRVLAFRGRFRRSTSKLLPSVHHKSFDNKIKKGSEQFETLSELNTQFGYDNNNNSYSRLNLTVPISTFIPPPISGKKLPTFYSSEELLNVHKQSTVVAGIHSNLNKSPLQRTLVRNDMPRGQVSPSAISLKNGVSTSKQQQ